MVRRQHLLKFVLFFAITFYLNEAEVMDNSFHFCIRLPRTYGLAVEHFLLTQITPDHIWGLNPATYTRCIHTPYFGVTHAMLHTLEA